MKQAIILIVLAAFFALQVHPTVFTQVCAVICSIGSLYFIIKWQKYGSKGF